MASGANGGKAGELDQTLGLGVQRRHHFVRWTVLLLVLVVAAMVLRAYLGEEQTAAPQYKSVEAHRGELVVTVSATGNLEPVNQVDVGSEISGTVKSIKVDYNDRVKKGEVLAELDTDEQQAKVNQMQAALEAAQASVQQAAATTLETQLKFKRCQDLAKQKMCSQQDLDGVRAAFARAQAEEASAKAKVAQARASLSAEQTRLAKAVIRSPIDGIVLVRQIEPGQTVAASLQAPVLFTLAESLKQMELYVAIDEADVGQVEVGQRANFTVDAYPDRSYPATISEVRYSPQTVAGVVTYTAVLSVDNADLSLRPGMTATADIVVKRLENVLLVPNAALRFTPPSNGAAAAENTSFIAKMFPRPRRRTTPKAKPSSLSGKQRVWVLENGMPKAIPVTVGATNGQLTEVVSGDLKAGTPVLVDYTGGSQ